MASTTSTSTGTSTTITTTTMATRPATVSEALLDYAMHHSHAQDEPAAAAAAHTPRSWDALQHRRVPPYRPTNRHLDQSERAVYRSQGERVFISVLFLGVLINASAAKLWGMTLGRVHDGLFRYPLGGEI